MALVVLKQIVIMFALVLVGFLMYRGKLIRQEQNTAIGNILIYSSGML